MTERRLRRSSCSSPMTPIDASGATDSDSTVVFLHASDGNTTRKAKLSTNASLDELKQLFIDTMQMNAFQTLNDVAPLYIRHRETGIEYELTDVNDVYPLAFISVRAHTESSNLIPPEKSYVASTMKRSKLVIVMVGRPAGGKTFVAQKLARYLNWLGVRTKVFSVAERRRETIGFQPANYYNPANIDGIKSRWKIASETLDTLIDYLIVGSGTAAIFDANNSTEERRLMVLRRLRGGGIAPTEVMFVELADISEKPAAMDAEHEYKSMDINEAMAHFNERFAYYKQSYEPLNPLLLPSSDESDDSNSDDRNNSIARTDSDRLDLNASEQCMKIVISTKRRQLIMTGVSSYVSQRIVSLLMNVRTRKKKIFFTRHGESQYNLTGRLGGNSSLSDAGQQYAVALHQWFNENLSSDEQHNLVVWTSTLRRTIETAQYFTQEKIALPTLDEIDAGICDGMTYQSIAQEMPHEFAARKKDKLRYRYPRGESYVDVIQRLEPVLFELERIERPVLVICHQAITRVLLAYFRDVDPSEIPYFEVPLHTLIEITPTAYTLDMKTNKLI